MAGASSVDITDDKASNVDIWLLSTRDADTTRFTFGARRRGGRRVVP